MPEKSLAVFEGKRIRRHYNEATNTWYFSIIDIVQVFIQQPDYQAARKYWNKLKERLKKEGSESVTKCHRLKLEAADGKKYLTDVADPETLLRLTHSVPSPKAELYKRWLAQVGTEQEKKRGYRTDLNAVFAMLENGATAAIARRRDAQGENRGVPPGRRRGFLGRQGGGWGMGWGC
jgi:hypothetical protein